MRGDPVNAEGRHAGTQHLAQFFTFDQLDAELQPPSLYCAGLAQQMIDLLEDGPELSAGLRHLLEAKDCFVRQALLDRTVG
jgi:hypothetical protein